MAKKFIVNAINDGFDKSKLKRKTNPVHFHGGELKLLKNDEEMVRYITGLPFYMNFSTPCDFLQQYTTPTPSASTTVSPAKTVSNSPSHQRENANFRRQDHVPRHFNNVMGTAAISKNPFGGGVGRTQSINSNNPPLIPTPSPLKSSSTGYHQFHATLPQLQTGEPVLNVPFTVPVVPGMGRNADPVVFDGNDFSSGSVPQSPVSRADMTTRSFILNPVRSVL